MGNSLKLTKSAVDSIPLAPQGQAYYWDSAVPGFGLRVGGKTKAYFAEGRVKGRNVRYTIGKHGTWTADKARMEAKEVLMLMSKGVNPNDEKVQGKAKSITLGEVFKSYLETHQLKPLTLRDYKYVMDGPLQDWASKPVAGITKDMISRRHAKLGERSQARANLTMRVLRAVLNFAVARYEDTTGRAVLLDNPVKRLSDTRAWFAVDRRKTVIKAHEVAAWYGAVARLPADATGAKRGTVRDYLLLLLFTGLRRTEAATLRWEDVDFTAKTLTCRDTKNREDHTLPMSDFVHALLLSRKEAKDEAKPEAKDVASASFVFPGEGRGGYLVEPRKQMERVEKESGVQFTLHDLRRTFGTIAESLDIPSYAIKRLLNHKMKADVTAGYIVMDVERLRLPMQKIADFILSAADVKPAAEITDLRTTRKKPAKSAQVLTAARQNV